MTIFPRCSFSSSRLDEEEDAAPGPDAVEVENEAAHPHLVDCGRAQGDEGPRPEQDRHPPGRGLHHRPGDYGH